MTPPPLFRLPERIGWRDHLIGAALAVVYVVWLVTGARALGFPRDEGVYFRAGRRVRRWWRSISERGTDAFQQGAIDAAFSANHEHPPLMKTLFGLSGWLFHEKWHVFTDASTAMRLPAMATAGLAIWVTYLFGRAPLGRRAGLVAGVLLALMPRVFFHAHLACFDVPITAMWILCCLRLLAGHRAAHLRVDPRGGRRLRAHPRDEAQRVVSPVRLRAARASSCSVTPSGGRSRRGASPSPGRSSRWPS